MRRGLRTYLRKLDNYKRKLRGNERRTNSLLLVAASRSKKYTRSRRILTQRAIVASKAFRGIKQTEPGCACGTCNAYRQRVRYRKMKQMRERVRGEGFYWDRPESKITRSLFDVELSETCGTIQFL